MNPHSHTCCERGWKQSGWMGLWGGLRWRCYCVGEWLAYLIDGGVHGGLRCGRMNGPCEVAAYVEQE